MSTIARRQIRGLMQAALTAFTGVKVESPGDWLSQSPEMPSIKIRCGTDRKVSRAKGPPAFTTTVLVELMARVQANSAVEAQDALDELCAGIEDGIFGNANLLRYISQFSTVTTTTMLTAEGKTHFGAVEMSIECELFESFDPVDISPTALDSLQQFNVHLDMAQPFDATGTYGGSIFPDSVKPAPRATGPDGRDEAFVQIPVS